MKRTIIYGEKIYQIKFLAYFPYFGKIKYAYAITMLSVYPPPHQIFKMDEPIFMKLGMYFMAPEPISTAYFINPSHQSVSVCVSPYRC
jgi:hypothetical protein